MAQVLEQPQEKQLTLADVIPQWAAILEENSLKEIIEEYSHPLHQQYLNHMTCLVGEFHGGDDRYAREGSDGYCNECHHLSSVQGYVEYKLWQAEGEESSINGLEPEELQRIWEEGFLKHVQKAHPDKVKK